MRLREDEGLFLVGFTDRVEPNPYTATSYLAVAFDTADTTQTNHNSSCGISLKTDAPRRT